MKISSYTESGYAVPAGITDQWPVPFQKGYAEFLKKTEQAAVYLLTDEESGITVPLQVKTVKVFRIGQLLFAPCLNAQPVNAGIQQSFFNLLIQYLQQNNICHRLAQPHPMGISDAHPADAQWCHFGTYLNDLQAGTDEELLHTFDPKYRKAVQHSQKNGGIVRFGPEVLDDFYELYTTTTKRAGIYTDSKDYFKVLIDSLGEHAEAGVVYDENGPLGSIFNLWSGYHSLCTHAGSSGRESRLYGAMKQLHYEMMLRMKARGVKWYDLVGVRINSDNPGLQGVFRFKKGFGGKLHQGFLWKKDIAVLPMQVFDLLIRLRNKGKKPHGDIIDQEGHPVEKKEPEIKENASLEQE